MIQLQNCFIKKKRPKDRGAKIFLRVGLFCATNRCGFIKIKENAKTQGI
jgi:hypothetical protein